METVTVRGREREGGRTIHRPRYRALPKMIYGEHWNDYLQSTVLHIEDLYFDHHVVHMLFFGL